MIAYIHTTDGLVLSHDFGNITVRQAWCACRKQFGHAQKNFYRKGVTWNFEGAKIQLTDIPVEIHYSYRTKRSK